MTGYHLRLGYTYDGKGSFGEIVEIARSIDKNEFRLKCIEYGVPREVVYEYINKYDEIPSDDATISIVGEQQEDLNLMQLASGGDPSRSIKEKVRKAFCILVMDECFKRGIPVSLSIS